MTNWKLLSFLALAWASAVQAGQTGLFYKSQPDDPNLSGSEAFYTDTQRSFSTSQLIYGEEDSSEVTIALKAPPDFTNAFPTPTTTTLHFSAPEGAPLAVGSYPNATSAWTTSQPGLELSGGEFSYCPGSTGSFEVKEVVFDPTVGAVTRFAADFVSWCPGTSKTTEGSLRYNSDVPFPPDIPLAIGSDTSLNSKGCLEATSMAGRRVALRVVNGKQPSQNYDWSVQVEGRPADDSCPPLTLCLPSSSETSILRTLTGDGETFAFDLARVNDDEQAKVVLKATDDLTGEVEQARLTACVSDSTPPVVKIHSPREGDNIVGNNFIVDVSVEDSVDPDPSYIAQLGPYVIDIEPGKVMRVEVPKWLLGKGERLETTFKVRAKDASFNLGEASVNVTVQHDMRK